MKNYLNTLIIMTVVSQLAVRFAPGKEYAKKYVSFVCGLVVMLCLLEPISVGIKNAGEFVGELKEMFTCSEKESVTRDKYYEAANIIIAYISETYRIDVERIRMTLITDEADENIREIHIFIKNCDSKMQSKIETDLTRELSVPIFVFTE